MVFFRTLKSWAHITQRDAISWNVPVYSIGDKSGSLVIDGEFPELTRCWCVLDGRVFYVEKASISKGATSLTLRLPFHAFDRGIAYAGDGTEELGDFITDVLTDEFIGQSDTEYAMPYLRVSSSGETNADLPYIPGEVYSLLDIFLLGLEKGLSYTFETSANNLDLTIAPGSPASHNLFWDNRTEMVSASVSRELVARVTVRRVDVTEDEITVDSSTDYYWQSDGTISTSVPSPRVPGIWTIVSVEDDDISSEDAAKEAMSGNQTAWKIAIRTDREYNIGDTITVPVYGESVSAQITSCYTSSTDTRYTYELGDMPTTLTDKFTAATTKRQETSVVVENSDPVYLPESGGTIGGNMSINGKVYASTLRLGSSSYGSSLPASGDPGQIFFVI